jgi:hypothetical protein
MNLFATGHSAVSGERRGSFIVYILKGGGSGG